MNLTIRAYWCPKSAGVRAEWEDGYAFSEPDGVVAVADGATWAAQSRRWARELTTRYVAAAAAGHAIDAATMPAWLDGVRTGFDLVAAAPAAAAPPEMPDGWWSEEVAARGAAAAFVGLRIDAPTGRWVAHAVGDACLFHFPAAGGVVSFPLDSPEQFTSSPVLVSSVEPTQPEDVRAAEGHAGEGDLFVLASDAISSWIVQELCEGNIPSTLLGSIRSTNYGELVNHLRRSGRIPDDDVTVVRVHVNGQGGT